MSANTSSILLANGNLCRWNGKCETIKPTVWIESVSAIASFFNKKVVLTHDCRLLAGTEAWDNVTDITSDVRIRLGKNYEEAVTEIHMYKSLLVVVAGNRICIISLKHGEKRVSCRGSKLHKFEHGINLVRFGKYHGFIRTNDNCLYITESEKTYESLYSRACAEIVPIDFVDAHNIRDIICGPRYSLFIMDDDSIRTHGLTNVSMTEQHTGIGQLELCQTDHVIKVVPCAEYVFYITEDGRCYYNYTLHIRRPFGEDRCPVLLKSLAGLAVENVFMTRLIAIVKYDTNKLCLLSQSGITNLYYVRGTKAPTPLPFFDDKDITNIMCTCSKVYFTTTEGHVYQACEDTFEHTLTAERIEFFDENPVAVDNPAPRIPSGRSCLDD